MALLNQAFKFIVPMAHYGNNRGDFYIGETFHPPKHTQCDPKYSDCSSCFTSMQNSTFVSQPQKHSLHNVIHNDALCQVQSQAAEMNKMRR
jgi:hypothetical protein